MIAAVDRFLFREASAESLALFRIAFYLLTLPYLFYWLRNYTATDFPPELFHHYILGGLPIRTIEASSGMTLLLGLLFLLCAAGFLTPLAQLTAAATALALFGNPVQYGVHPETSCPLLLCLGILPFARTGDAYSLDSRLRRKSRADAALYGWPIQVTRALWVWVFFTAGCFKLLHTGAGWVTRDGLGAFLMVIPYMRYPARGAVAPLAAFLLDHPLLTELGSWFTVLVELAMPLALVSRLARALLVPTAMVMLLLVLYTLKPPFFLTMLPLSLAWLPWFPEERAGVKPMFRQAGRG